MAKLNISTEWWTSPAEGDQGGTVMVTGRKGLQNVIDTGKYIYRVEVTWPYDPDSQGMPSMETSRRMEEAHEALEQVFTKDPVAVNTGIYTGDGERNWVFYTRSLNIFQRKFNEALADFPTLPLEFHAYEDPDWDEYREMSQNEVSSSQ